MLDEDLFSKKVEPINKIFHTLHIMMLGLMTGCFYKK